MDDNIGNRGPTGGWERKDFKCYLENSDPGFRRKLEGMSKRELENYVMNLHNCINKIDYSKPSADDYKKKMEERLILVQETLSDRNLERAGDTRLANEYRKHVIQVRDTYLKQMNELRALREADKKDPNQTGKKRKMEPVEPVRDPEEPDEIIDLRPVIRDEELFEKENIPDSPSDVSFTVSELLCEETLDDEPNPKRARKHSEKED